MKITLHLFSKQTFSVSFSRRAEAPQSILYKSETEIFEKKFHPPRSTNISTTDKRTDVWSRDFMIWRINFGLWAVAWDGQWGKKGLG